VAIVGETVTASTGGVTVTSAEPDLVESAELVALTVTVVFAVTAGAVNNPEEEIVPAVVAQVTPVLVVPVALEVNCCVPEEELLPVVVFKVTPVLLVPVMLAVNCCVLPEDTVAVCGETATGGVTVTTAEPDLVESAELVALTLTVVVTVTAGAVNNPEEDIVPAVVFQVTPVFLVPVTVAVNCCVPPEVTVAVGGETATATTVVLDPAKARPPPSPPDITPPKNKAPTSIWRIGLANCFCFVRGRLRVMVWILGSIRRSHSSAVLNIMKTLHDASYLSDR